MRAALRLGKRGWKWWAVVAAWLLIIMFVAYFDAQLVAAPLSTVLGSSSTGGHVTTYTLGGDFTMYYAAARALRQNPHANIYSLATLRAAYGGGCGQPPTTAYPYQPLLALLLEPMTLLPCSTALFAWWQLSFLLWGIITFWYTRDATVRYGPGRGLLVGALCAGFFPIWDGLEHGQLHLLILFVFVLASRLVARRLPQRAGGALAFGAVLKYFPAVVLVYHLARGRWKLALAAALTGIAMLLIELVIVGPMTLVGSIHGATADIATYAAMHRNWTTGIPAGPLLARLMLLTALGALAWLSWRRRAVNEALGEGWVLCAALLAAPLAWYHYLTWLLPAIIALFHAALDGTRAIRPGWSLEAITRRLPLVGFAAVIGMIEVPGAEEYAIGPALIILWVMCGSLILLNAWESRDPPSRIPAPAAPTQEPGALAGERLVRAAVP